jgi:hypothetical protein
LLVTLAAALCIWNGALSGDGAEPVWAILLGLIVKEAAATVVVVVVPPGELPLTALLALPVVGPDLSLVLELDDWVRIPVSVYVVVIVLTFPAESVYALAVMPV